MRDYAKLTKVLRYCSTHDCIYDGEIFHDCEARNCDIAPRECDTCNKILQWQAADAIEELVAELTTIRKQLPHWISVEERLPEHYKPVLVAYIGFNSNLLLSDMIAYRDGDGDWCWWDGEFPSGEICEVKVTYWMPLPAPPKGVE